MTRILTPAALEAAAKILCDSWSTDPDDGVVYDANMDEKEKQFYRDQFRAAFDAAIEALKAEGRITDRTDSIDPRITIWLLPPEGT